MFWMVMPIREEDKKHIKDNINNIWKLSHIINELYDKNVFKIGIRTSNGFYFDDNFNEILSGVFNNNAFAIDEYGQKYTIDEFLKEIIN